MERNGKGQWPRVRELLYARTVGRVRVGLGSQELEGVTVSLDGRGDDRPLKGEVETSAMRNQDY